jgi:hypothetical protein
MSRYTSGRFRADASCPYPTFRYGCIGGCGLGCGLKGMADQSDQSDEGSLLTVGSNLECDLIDTVCKIASVKPSCSPPRAAGSPPS